MVTIWSRGKGGLQCDGQPGRAAVDFLTMPWRPLARLTGVDLHSKRRAKRTLVFCRKSCMKGAEIMGQALVNTQKNLLDVH